MIWQRVSAIAVVLWLAIVAGVDRLLLPGLLSLPFCLIAATLGVIAMTGRMNRRLLPFVATAASLAALAGLRWDATGDMATNVPMLLAESIVLLVFAALVFHFARRMLSFEDAVVEMQRLMDGPSCLDFQAGQVAMYGTVRRARQTGQPLTMLAFAPDGGQPPAELHSLIVRVQHSARRRLRDRAIAGIVGRHLGEHDVIVQRNGHFLALLVEADDDRGEKIDRELTLAAERELGVKLRTSKATFPQQEVTFSGLLTQAESGLYDPPKRRPKPQTNGRVSATPVCDTPVNSVRN